MNFAAQKTLVQYKLQKYVNLSSESIQTQPSQGPM